MKKIYYSIAISVMTGTSFLSAQTNPTPWNLNSAGNYSFTSFSPSASSFPGGMAIHRTGASPTTLSTAASGDVPLPCGQVQTNNTNVWGNNAKGIGIRSNPVAASVGYTNGQSSQVIVAVNTTSRTTVKVSFKAGTADPGSAQSAVYRLRCQYRVGSSGAWLEMPGGPAEYQTINALDSVNMGPYTLPTAVNNQPVVQIRWIYYYVSGTWSGQNNRSHRAQLDDISITSLPVVSQSAFSAVCQNANPFTLSGGSPSGGTYSGTGVVGGTTFNPAIAGAGTFPVTYTYTDAFGMSNSASQNITVMAKPSVTASASSNPICPGNSTTLTGGGASTYTWTGGINNGVAFSPPSTSSYTVTGTNSNGCTNTAAIIVTVNAKPTVTANASANPICSGSSTTLSGGGATSYTWTGGVNNGVAFSPSSTTSYTVTGTDNNGCTNTASIAVSVNAKPTVTANASSNPICSGNSTILSGGGASSYAWTGGVSNGVAFSPSSTTSYTVTGTDNNGCTNQAAIAVTVNQIPSVTANSAINPVCSGNSTTLSGGGASSYAWTGGVSDGVAFNPSSTTTYTVIGTDNNGCTNTAAITITVNATPTVNVSGTMTITAGDSTTLTAAGCSTYNWGPSVGLSSNSGSPVVAKPSTTTAYSVTGSTSNCSNATTFTLTVIPAVGPTHLLPAYCGLTETSLRQYMYCVPVSNATNYLYQLTDQSNGNMFYYTRGYGVTDFQLLYVAGIGYAKTYIIRIAAYVNGAWTLFGSPCTITTPPAPITQLQASSCGITETSLDQVLTCDAVDAATKYRYEVTDASNGNIMNYVRTGNSNDLQLTWVSGTDYGKTYNIRVAAYAGGEWLNYGASCSVTTPVTAVTQLQAANCGITENSLDQVLHCYSVAGATKYAYELTDLSNGSVAGYIRTGPSNDFQMVWVPSVTYGKTYSIRVAGYTTGGWLAYGPSCTVTTPAAPATQLSAAYCGIVESSISQTLYCDAVVGATNYRYYFIDQSNGYCYSYVRGNSTDLQMAWVTGIKSGRTYNVLASAYVGGAWLAYGSACSVTTGSGTARLAGTSTEDPQADRMLLAGEENAKLYPNPNKGTFILEASRAADVRISNLLGVNVYNGRVTEGVHSLDLTSIEPGVYLVRVYDGKNSWLMRMIKE